MNIIVTILYLEEIEESIKIQIQDNHLSLLNTESIFLSIEIGPEIHTIKICK